MKMNLTPFTVSVYTEIFAVALLLSTMVHALFITGLSFVPPLQGKSHSFPTMDVILVQKRTDTVPDKPDFFAQVTQDGSGQGDPDKRARPSTPTFAPFPGPLAEFVVTPPLPQIAATMLDPEIQILATDKPSSFLVERQPFEPITPPEKPADEISGDAEETTVIPEELPDLDTLIVNELTSLTSIQAEINDRIENFVKRTVRHKYVDSSTKEHAYANYMDAWYKKTDPSFKQEYKASPGYKAFSEKTVSKGIEGVLVFDVAINSNGTIHSLELLDSSIRSPEIERMVRRSIYKVAPYPPFPNNLRKEVDVLHIIRSFEFYNDYRLVRIR